MTFTNDQMSKLMNLIKDMPPSNVQANHSGMANFVNHNVFFNVNFHKFYNNNTSVIKTSIG